MTDDEQRVANLIRYAFAGVTLGDGVGLRQASGLDDFLDLTIHAIADGEF